MILTTIAVVLPSVFATIIWVLFWVHANFEWGWNSWVCNTMALGLPITIVITIAMKGTP